MKILYMRVYSAMNKYNYYIQPCWRPFFDNAVMKSGDNSNINVGKSIKSEEDNHTA